ncbi:Bet v 1 domain-containing protein [Citrus sinensis]|uniref:Bet v 1 domain-containing protein n=1 Tax=Citrus sinensis TaxID=2711 RepID=A0ACB8I9D2_CITSI|nr:Bet v 1 domain-containing protein [Citrus sinensis]
MFKAVILDCHNLFPKLAPHAFKSIDILEGDGGDGTLKRYDFGDDGGWGIFEKVVYDIKFVASGDGRCIYKVAAECYLKAGEESKEEFVKDSQEKGTSLYRAVESHLLANPHLYA